MNIDVFTCKHRLPEICRIITSLVEAEEFSSGVVIVRFHAQKDWGAFFDLVPPDKRAIGMTCLGVIVPDHDMHEKVAWRAGLLRALGIEVGVFRTVGQLSEWAKDKVPPRAHSWMSMN